MDSTVQDSPPLGMFVLLDEMLVVFYHFRACSEALVFFFICFNCVDLK